jgi:hypothetical protein
VRCRARARGAAQAGFLSFMRQVKNAPAIGPLLESEPLASVAVAVEIIVADQDNVVRFRLRLTADRKENDSGECNSK